MAITASTFRANVYRVLDEALARGVPIEIERNGRILRVVPDVGASRLSRIVRRPDAVVGDSEDLVHVDWSSPPPARC